MAEDFFESDMVLIIVMGLISNVCFDRTDKKQRGEEGYEFRRI